MSASRPIQVWPYLQERFPLPTYALLTGLYVAGGASVALDVSGMPANPLRIAAAALVVLLVFFHLRIFDEFKDYARDCLNHPERLVQRGVVTLKDLKRWGALALVVEAALSAALGWSALVCWVLVLGFSVLMRLEFFIGGWLEKRPFTYAATHQPVMLFISAFIYAAQGLALHQVLWPALIPHQLAALGGMFSFEVARKLRAPADELEHDYTYTTAHGPRVAALVGGLLLCAAVVAESFLVGWGALVGCLLAGPFVLFGARPTRQHARWVNLAVSIALLGLHGVLAAGLVRSS